MNMNRKAGWLFAAVTWFCINVNADELQPLKYESVTNYVRYERDDGWRSVTNSTYEIERINYQTTNAPVAIVHSVTWGRGTNAVFVLKTCEPLKVPAKTNGWQNTEWKYYEAAAWVESVK